MGPLLKTVNCMSKHVTAFASQLKFCDLLLGKGRAIFVCNLTKKGVGTQHFTNFSVQRGTSNFVDIVMWRYLLARSQTAYLSNSSRRSL